MSQSHTCQTCIKMDSCKFFDTAVQLKEQFQQRFGEECQLPLIPTELAEKCNLYMPLYKEPKAEIEVAQKFLFDELHRAKLQHDDYRQEEIQKVIREMSGVKLAEIEP